MTTAALPRAARPSINVLGGFSVHVAQRPVPCRATPNGCSGFLAVTGVEHLRDTVAGHLWPTAVPERAMSNLRTALWRVRQADPDHPGRPRLDRPQRRGGDRLRVITSQARGIIAELPVDDLAITGAARLLEADLLPGWDEDWLLLDRERHRQLRIHALERLSELLTSAGHYGRAIDVACAAVRVEPLHEIGARRPDRGPHGRGQPHRSHPALPRLLAPPRRGGGAGALAPPRGVACVMRRGRPARGGKTDVALSS